MAGGAPEGRLRGTPLALPFSLPVGRRGAGWLKRGRGKSATIGDFSRRGWRPRARLDPRRLALTCADAVVPSVRRVFANGVPVGKVANRDT